MSRFDKDNLRNLPAGELRDTPLGFDPQDGGDRQEESLRDQAAQLAQVLDDGSADALNAQILDQHEADFAELIELLDDQHREELLRLLGGNLDISILLELSEAVREKMVAQIGDEVLAGNLRDVETDDAVAVIAELSLDRQVRILDFLPYGASLQISKNLGYPESSAGRLMTGDYVSIPPFWTVGEAIDYCRDNPDLPENFYDIHVVDENSRLLGSVALKDIIRSPRNLQLKDMMSVVDYRITTTDDQEEAARIFQRYNLVSSAVVNSQDQLIGVLTIDDIVDVIEDEATEDINLLAGVGDEEISSNVSQVMGSRFTWLTINLFTAILASVVIGFFEEALSQMIALAVLMPIVASMGGNAGAQTMTVAVRALATRDLVPGRFYHAFAREFWVSVLNGILLSGILAVVTFLWFDNLALSLIVCAAMMGNMVVAGIVGVLVPIALERVGFDPAVASTVFVSTATDVFGFMFFLAIAVWWYGF